MKNLTEALAGIQEASSPSELALRQALTVLDHPRPGSEEVETVLRKLWSWLDPDAPGGNAKMLVLFQSSGLPRAVLHQIHEFRNEPPVASLGCYLLQRSLCNSETASICMRAGVLEEVVALMDLHPAHGGVQNICLRLLVDLMKHGNVARQAVVAGVLPRVLKSLEGSTGREVQYNGCVALRFLADGGRAPRAGLQDVAMQAKVAHENDMALCVVANDVLGIVTPRFKEVLCWHFQSGWCCLGPRCSYAHGPEDLRTS